MTTSILWFRRDLRLSDHPALRAAREAADEIVPVFVVDDDLWAASGDNRRWFLHGCLRALDESLGGGLVIRRGSPATVLADLAAEVDATAVFCTDEFTPYGFARDEKVARALEADGRRLEALDSPFVAPPGSITTGSGDNYKVYTPYWRVWADRSHPEPMPKLRALPLRAVESEDLPARPDVDADLPDPGEDAASRAVDRFLAGPVDGYDDDRNDAAADATSRLSAHLHFGCVHPRQILHRLDRRNPGQNAFARQLAWRDFYGQVLSDRPDSAWSSYRDDLASMEIDDGAEAQERFEAWKAGRTGYPYVDAGMRQLRAEGWMHNRLRMVTASFLVKDLHIDWRWGARHFLDHLVDGDIANNNHGWQWVAGTGTDAAPYHRIFNPVTQSLRYDPDGIYIRRWVPELAEVGDPHEPWKASDSLFADIDYPERIVDHAVERDVALARYRAARE